MSEYQGIDFPDYVYTAQLFEHYDESRNVMRVGLMCEHGARVVGTFSAAVAMSSDYGRIRLRWADRMASELRCLCGEKVRRMAIMYDAGATVHNEPLTTPPVP